jgi:hypothetical protein
MKDPGNGKEIWLDRNFGVTPMKSAAAETRTLVQPTKAGLQHTLVLDVYVGAVTVTVTGGYNQAANTDIIFGTAGDWVTFLSVKVGSSYYWRVVAQEGTDAILTNLVVSALTLNGLDIFASNDMTPGAGWVAGITTPNVYNIYTIGGIIKTEIVILMTGLNGTGSAGDIIGDDGNVEYCHFGQITAAINGTLFGGRISCLETPAGGNDDVDFWSCIEDDGQNDEGLAGSMTGEVQHLNHGAWAAGEIAGLTTVPVADRYLYLAAGANTDADFSAGVFLLEMWGIAA